MDSLKEWTKGFKRRVFHLGLAVKTSEPNKHCLLLWSKGQESKISQNSHLIVDRNMMLKDEWPGHIFLSTWSSDFWCTARSPWRCTGSIPGWKTNLEQNRMHRKVMRWLNTSIVEFFKSERSFASEIDCLWPIEHRCCNSWHPRRQLTWLQEVA